MINNKLISINNYHYRRGGAEVIFLEHNRLFQDHGWEVATFCMHHPMNTPTPWESYFVEETEFGRSYTIIERAVRAARVVYSHHARKKLEALISRFTPGIAHAHNVYHHISPAIFPLLKNLGIPTVMTIHDLKLACPAYLMFSGGAVCEKCRGGRLHNVVLNKCIKSSLALSSLIYIEAVAQRLLKTYEANVDKFVVPSKFHIEKLVQWGWPRERFVHIPNFVKLDDFNAANTSGEGFVYIGRLDSRKGIDTLVRASAISSQPVTIVGTGPAENDLKKLSDRVGAKVRFVGFQTGEKLRGAVSASLALILPSLLYENGPVSIMEAYALGRPAIGARIGGIPEHIREDETGLTFSPGSSEDLADKMRQFAEMPRSRKLEMGAAARKLAETEFSPALYRTRILSLYNQLQR